MSIFRDKYDSPLSTSEALYKISARLRSYLLDFGLYLLTLVSYVPSHNLRKFMYRLSGMTIGLHSSLHVGCRFYLPSGITIGDDTIIGDRCFLDGRDKLSIGSHVDIASQVMIYNSQHDIDSESFTAITAPVEIQDYVFVGPRAIILPGVTLGRGSVVAAGAVVTHDIPAFALVGGVPAKIIRTRKLRDPHYMLGAPRLFQ